MIEFKEVEPADIPPEVAFADRVLPLSPDDDHWLVLEDLTDYWREQNPEWDGIWQDGDDHWEITVLHPEQCRHLLNGDARCGVEYEIQAVGLEDSFGGTIPKRGGKWRIEFWFESITIPMVGTEYDSGLRWVDDPEEHN